jgi:hypothetical protein
MKLVQYKTLVVCVSNARHIGAGMHVHFLVGLDPVSFYFTIKIKIKKSLYLNGRVQSHMFAIKSKTSFMQI